MLTISHISLGIFRSACSLTFFIDGADHTMQTIKLTQSRIVSVIFGCEKNFRLLFQFGFLQQVGSVSALAMGDKEFKEMVVDVVDGIGGEEGRRVFEGVGREVRGKLGEAKKSVIKIEVEKELRERDLSILERRMGEVRGALERAEGKEEEKEVEELEEEKLLEAISSRRAEIRKIELKVEGNRVKRKMKIDAEKSNVCPTCGSILNNDKNVDGDSNSHRHRHRHQEEEEEEEEEEEKEEEEEVSGNVAQLQSTLRRLEEDLAKVRQAANLRSSLLATLSTLESDKRSLEETIARKGRTIDCLEVETAKLQVSERSERAL